MGGPVYKLWMMKLTPAARQLSEEEMAAAVARTDEALAKVGGRRVMLCKSRWAAEQWDYFGIDEFPSIEAEQEFADLTESGAGYVESFSLLGIKWPPS
jgi:hypothetical protein